MLRPHRSPTRRLLCAGAAVLALTGVTACAAGNGETTSAPPARVDSVPAPIVIAGRHLRLSRAEIHRRAVARQIAVEKRRLAAIAAQNPLAQHPWGTYTGPHDKVNKPYDASRGTTRALLARIANQPRATWFGAWVPDADIRSTIREYIAGSQHGNPNALVQLSVFRMDPWEHAICGRSPSARQAASYRHWIDALAAGIGSTPTAVVLQPDGPFALCARGGTVGQLLTYAARTLSALPRTSVYLDAGAGDWPAAGAQGGVAAAARFLVADGVRYTRGFALDATHYSATSVEVARGAAIAKALAAEGIAGKKFVVNTSSNGHPFVFGDYRGGDPDNARVCSSLASRDTCVALGIPPTTKVADPRWGLPASTATLAAEYCDAYLWFGRPWLKDQADPFEMSRALQLVRTWRY